ncbi:MAG: AAA family ATPase [Campylobacterales bacterium]
MARSDLYFPVIRKITVRNYGLYPGKEGDGFTYKPKQGPNIILGVNGLGKTTLLNMLLRVVTGLKEVKSQNSYLGMGAREVAPVDRSFFAGRVLDGGVSAYVEAEVEFGQSLLYTKRKLSNLELQAMALDGKPILAEGKKTLEEQFVDTVMKLSGVENYYDYLFLTQYLFFYLEDRRELVWNKHAQTEVLRILFYDREDQNNYLTLYNDIVRKDSAIRNTHATLSRLHKEYEKTIKVSADPNAKKELELVEREISSLEQELNDTDNAFEDLMKQRSERISARENSKIEREGIRARQKEIIYGFLEERFADADRKFAYMVRSLIGGSECTLCGSPMKKIKPTQENADQNNGCPLCGGEIKKFSSGFDSSEIDMLGVQATKIDDSIENLDKSLREIEEALNTKEKMIGALRKHKYALSIQANVLRKQIPKDNEVDTLVTKIGNNLDIVEVIQQEKENDERNFAALVERGRQTVSSLSEKVIENFSRYIKGFMAERCVLEYSIREEKIGQGKSVAVPSFPHFSIRLTSGAFKSAPANRDGGEDVSESQREFIDLAFRMSLIAEITTRCPAMMFVETPEASLDSVFIPRAGTMIRTFLGTSNYLIASTNLNREAMVPALFGVVSENAAIEAAKRGEREFRETVSSAVPLEERADRIINLLSLGAKNAALETYGEEYWSGFEQAISPDWERYELALAMGKR